VCPARDAVEDFLRDWSERRYTDIFGSKTIEKRFGLSRATTLLYFLSGGRFPIFDSRVRRAIRRLCGERVPNSVKGYTGSFVPRFREIAQACQTRDLRQLDRALFSFGGKY
jgi:hypothetical protein